MEKSFYLRPSIRIRSLTSDLLQGGIDNVSTDVNIDYGGEGGDDDEPRGKWGNIWDDSDTQDEDGIWETPKSVL